jgi:SAM-dependent methyltransferase
MIEDIYKNIVSLPSSYFTKYIKLPDFPGSGNGEWKGWAGHDYPRTWCLLDFIEWTSSLRGKTLAYTSTHDPELEFIYEKYEQKIILPYPQYDLHDLPNSINNSFDFFLFNQTIEHLHNPFLAMQNINRVMKKDGYVFTSVPTINIPHMTPYHFNGFTPMGLAMLFINSGFSVEKIGQWGNYKYISQLFKTHTWPDINTLKDESGLVSNEERNCCQCWILARKN